MMMKHFVSTAIIILFVSIYSPAQTTDLDVCSEIEASVKAKAPEWRVERKSRSCHTMSYFKWVSGKSQVYAFVYPESSVENAKEAYALLASDAEMTLEKINVIAINIDAVGEENRLWDTRTLKSVGIDFRWGKVVVRVSSASMEETRKFAKYVAAGVGAA